MDQQLFHQLKQAIDKHTIANVLEALAEVCSENAEHASTNLQDDRAACKRQAIADELTAIDPRIP